MRPFETIQAPRTLAPNNHARDWTMFGLLGLAFLIRATAIIAFPSLHYSDETTAMKILNSLSRHIVLLSARALLHGNFQRVFAHSSLPFSTLLFFLLQSRSSADLKGMSFSPSWCLRYRRWLA